METVESEDSAKLQIDMDGTGKLVENTCPSKSVLGLCNGESSITLQSDLLQEDEKVENEQGIVTEEIMTDSVDKANLNCQSVEDEQSHGSLSADVDVVANSNITTKPISDSAPVTENTQLSASSNVCIDENVGKTSPTDEIFENGVCSEEDNSGDKKENSKSQQIISKAGMANDCSEIHVGDQSADSHAEKSEATLSSQKENHVVSENHVDSNVTIAKELLIESCKTINTDTKESMGEVNNSDNIGHSFTCVVNQDKKEDVIPLQKKKQKARKSCQPQGGSITQSASGYQATTAPSAKSTINVASFAKKTIKVTELESVLGIKTKSLDKMDAKTLDKLVLQKAQQQRAKIDGRLKQENAKHTKVSESPSLTSNDKRNSLEHKPKTSGPTGKIKGKGTVSPNQLITQFMVREPVQKNYSPLPHIGKDSHNANTEATDEVDRLTQATEAAATTPSKLNTATGTSVTGVSAYIAGQHLLSRSKKKKKIYKGKSGNYRLPGQKKANLRRRDSSDSGGTLKQRQSSHDMFTGGSSAGDFQKSEEIEDDMCDELPDLDGDLISKPVQESSSLSPVKRRKYTPRKLVREKDIDHDQEDDENSGIHLGSETQQSRKSSRKRKLPVFNDDTESTISTETYGSGYDSSDNELDEPPDTDEEDIITEAEENEASKRRKMYDEKAGSDSGEIIGKLETSPASTIPHLSPIKAPTSDPSISKAYRSPPKITPALPFMGCSPRVGPVPTMEERKPAENATVPQEMAAGHPYKFMNTPNGVSYPVTPPETPDSTVSSLEDRSAASGERDREGGRLPVCYCKLPGSVFSCKTEMYCQALDSVDGKVHGCMNKVNSSQLLRPSVKIPFMAICENHKQRLKVHQCCPGCGNFCTQGTFYQCKDSSSSQMTIVHYYHKHCQVYKDDKYFCPHCGDQSAQYEVHVQAAQAKQSVSVKYDKKDQVTNARMEFRRCSTDSVKSSHSNSGVVMATTEEQDYSPSGVTPNLKTKFKIKVDTENFPIGPCKKDLEKAIQQFSCEEKKKKFRASNKNLYQACKSNDLERVLYLLCEGIDPNEKFEDHKQQSSIHVAASKGYLAIVHLLVQAKASVHAIDEDLRTALMYAAEEGYTSVVRYLLKCHAVPDARASDGMTPLHLAAQSGEVEAVKHIVQTRNINVNIKDDGGWTPMIWAAEHRHIDTVRFLLEVGSDPNLRDNEDNTGLHWAVYSGSTDIAELFLNAGCDMEAANEHGDRPLHIATRQDHYECVVLLLARGADSTAVNNRNDNPLNCCFDKTSPIHMAIQVNQQLKKVASQITRPPRLLHRDVTCGKEQYPIAIVNEFDDENYPTDYLYVNDYVETVPMNINRVITSLRSCECRDNCVSLSCECSRNSVKCWYTDEGKLPDDFNFTEPPYVFECNKACKCWSSCQNRVVQMGISVRLQVFRAPGKGWGVRSLLQIPKGTYVCEYIGEILSDAEADRREDDSYLFDLDNRDSDSFCIDARQYGNVSRFINHRCEPNLSPVKVFVDHQDLRFPRICFFANRDIKPYEELGFDYGDKFWVIKYKQFTCTCDSTKCRYSKDTINKTVTEYYRRIKEAEDSDS